MTRRPARYISHRRGLLGLKKETCDLAAIVRQVEKAARPVLEEAGLQLSPDLTEPAWVIGESTRLAQIVRNLLDNANKFRDKGGR
jgi:signal transduction histidine kinase